MTKYDFTYDVYISYATKDNIPGDSGKGWVDQFQKFLEILLFQILGEKPVFLQIAGNEKPSSETLQKCGIMVAILSPEYVYNEYCLEELEDFVSKANQAGKYLIKGHERVFKVTKYPIELHNQPQKLKPLLSYDLYYSNQETGEVHEFKDFFNSEAERKFWLKLVDLAYDISDLLRQIRFLELETIDNELYNTRHVYLAEVSPDLQLHRDNIRRELQRHGFYIFPDRALPTNTKELEVVIKKYLERSRLSIHLIGDAYGDVLPGSEVSLLELQHIKAGEHGQLVLANGDNFKKFNRMIWIAPEAELEEENQRMFVERLRRELELNEGAEILQAPIEDFKMMVLDELLELRKDSLFGFNILNENKKKSIYFIYDKVDEFEAQRIIDSIDISGYEIIKPNFNGNLLELRELYLNNLRTTDYVFVYIGKVNDLWIQMKYLDILKSPGLGRVKGQLPGAFILSKSNEDRKPSLMQYNLPILSTGNQVQEEIKNFINEHAYVK